jgi:hypothetical protein
MVQLKGVVYVGLFAFLGSLAFWYAIKFTLGVRVSAEEELEGLDIGEHGISAYPDFALHPGSFTGTLTGHSGAASSLAASAVPHPMPVKS